MKNPSLNSSRKAQTSKNENINTDLTTSSEKGLSVKTKADVPGAIKVLEEKLAILKGDVEDTISTDILYDHRNVKDITEVRELLKFSASIRARAKTYAEEVKFYNLEEKVEDFSHSEKSEKEWYKIIAKAIFELINNSQIKIIEESIAELSEFLDEDTKLENKLTSIMQKASQKLK